MRSLVQSGDEYVLEILVSRFENLFCMGWPVTLKEGHNLHVIVNKVPSLDPRRKK